MRMIWFPTHHAYTLFQCKHSLNKQKQSIFLNNSFKTEQFNRRPSNKHVAYNWFILLPVNKFEAISIKAEHEIKG